MVGRASIGILGCFSGGLEDGRGEYDASAGRMFASLTLVLGGG